MKRKNYLLIGFWILDAFILGYFAWHGWRLSVGLLVFAVISLGVISQLSSALNQDTLDLQRDTREGWHHEIVFASRVTRDYAQMLGLLYEHDPSAAEVFQDRLSEALRERSPEISLAVAELSAQAEKN